MDDKQIKYVVVCGATASGIGKGIAASSIAAILKASGFTISMIKIDPYLNIDAGTMSPYEHGEVFVLDDGGEVDLDLGNYERFLDLNLKKFHNITTGKVYDKVLKSERKGQYLGKTVQIVPHVTDQIKAWVTEVSRIPTDESMRIPDICLIELGGTVGDIESSVFLEALRQLQVSKGEQNVLVCLVTYVPTIGTTGEQKTKPTQHGLKELRSAGLAPNFIICRTTAPMQEGPLKKVALFSGLPEKHVFNLPDLENVAQVPLKLESQGIMKLICDKMNLHFNTPDMSFWKGISKRMLEVAALEEILQIAFVGKYIEFEDAYLSVTKSLEYASLEAFAKIKINFIEAEHLEDEIRKHEGGKEMFEKAWNTIKRAKGIFVAGGFGFRGVEGKISAVQYARENKIPFLGVCFGFQLAVVEICRHVLNWNAISEEFLEEIGKQPDQKSVIIYMPEIDKDVMGGTLRLGSKSILVDNEKSLAYRIYGAHIVKERHRHRYEVNPQYIKQIMSVGVSFTGVDELRERMEFLELKDHPFFFATQPHPELKSKINKPSPPFLAFVLAAAGKLDKRFEENNGLLFKPNH